MNIFSIQKFSFSTDFEDEMSVYDSNEDLFGVYIVLNFFEKAYEMIYVSHADEELCDTIE